MEVLVELILELVAQLFVEERWDGAGRRQASRCGRRVAVGGSGTRCRSSWRCWRGWHGGSSWQVCWREALPRSVWVSVALGAICVLMAVIARLRGVPVGDSLGGWRAFRRPDRWPAIRWLSFAVMSAVIAVAIVIEFPGSAARMMATAPVSSRAARARAMFAGMETWDAIRARRNVRRFTDQPIGATN